MSTIRCPECNNKVSDSSIICQSCGYPIEQYVKKLEFEKQEMEKELVHQKEIDRLTNQIKDLEFTCPPPRLKVCLKCGRPFSASQNVDDPDFDTPICKCGFPGVEIDYPLLGNHSGLEHYLYILRHEVIPRNIGDKESKEYLDSVTSLYTQIEKSEKRNKSSGYENWKIKQLPPDKKDFGVTPEMIRYKKQQSTLKWLRERKEDEIKAKRKFIIAASIFTALSIPCFINYEFLLLFALAFAIIAILLWCVILYYGNRSVDQIDKDIAVAEKDIQAYKSIVDMRAKALNSTTEPTDPLLPHCPFCSSTDLTKISGLGKALKIWAFGLYGMDDTGKTYKCNNCGGKF